MSTTDMKTTAEPCPNPKPATASQSEGRPGIDRRKHPRYPVSGCRAEVRAHGMSVPICAWLTDISLGGCRLETTRVFLGGRLLPQPLPALSCVDLLLTLKGQQLQAKGQLVLSHPNFGMGVKFLHVSDPDREMLAAWIAALASGAASSTGRGSDPDPAPALDQEAAARLGRAVTEFFRSQPAMSREEFLQLAGK